MSGLVTSGEKHLVLVSGRAHMDLAHAVGEEIGCGVSPVTAYDFASGEIYVRFNESVRGADVFVLQSIAGDINKWVMEQLIMMLPSVPLPSASPSSLPSTPTRVRTRSTRAASLSPLASWLTCTAPPVPTAS